MQRILPLVLLGVTLACWACSSASEGANTAAPGPQATGTAEQEGPWDARLLAIAADCRTYTKMANDPHWAPTMCRAPMHSSAFISKAEEGSAHGRKLYFLWVKDAPAYPSPRWREDSQSGKAAIQPAGQALVKESFHPGEGANPTDPKAPRTLGAKADLFVMFKVEPNTPGTDLGWVYGTLSADGKKVTSAGRIESCMGCHENARHDRLFGMPAGSGKAPRADAD